MRLQDVWPQSLGTDLSYEAIAFCRQRGLDRIFRGTVINVPIRDGAIDGIVCLDALYHRQVSNDLTALREFYRLLKPGGMLVMNLPAFAFLNGSHDRAVHTRERYTVHQLRDRLQGAGFQVFRLTYRNLLLFPILLVKRGWDRHRVGASDLSLLSGWLNTFLFRISQFESWVLEHTDLPLGTSVFCVAKKPR